MQGMTTFACYCGRKHVVQLLLDHSDPNFDWNARNNDGWIAFILACFYAHINIVQLLLDNSERIELNANVQLLLEHFRPTKMIARVYLTLQLTYGSKPTLESF